MSEKNPHDFLCCFFFLALEPSILAVYPCICVFLLCLNCMFVGGWRDCQSDKNSKHLLHSPQASDATTPRTFRVLLRQPAYGSGTTVIPI